MIRMYLLCPSGVTFYVTCIYFSPHCLTAFDDCFFSNVLCLIVTVMVVLVIILHMRIAQGCGHDLNFHWGNRYLQSAYSVRCPVLAPRINSDK